MKKNFSLFLIIIVFVNFVNSFLPINVSASDEYSGAYIPTSFEINSRGAYMLNLNTDTVVFSKNADKRMYPASLTKIMTAIIVLELCGDPETEKIIVPTDITMFDEIYKVGGSNIGLKSGEILTVKDLLYALMLPSACDAASLLAYYFGGGQISAFVDLMNKKAVQLGAENTHFSNAHGLHADDHYSSPYDISLLIKYALSFPLFKEIISATSYTIPATDKSKARNIEYTITMLSEKSSDYYPYMSGIKSGFTSLAGRCLSSYAKKDTDEYILVLLGSNLDQPAVSDKQPNLVYTDTKILYEYAFSHFSYRKVVSANELVITKEVRNGKSSSAELFSSSDIYAFLPSDTNPELVFSLPDILLAPLDSGSVGKLFVYYSGKRFGEAELLITDPIPVLSSSITQPGIDHNPSVDGTDTRLGPDEFRKLLNDRPFLILIIVLLVFIMLFVGALLVSAKASSKRKNARFK